MGSGLILKKAKKKHGLENFSKKIIIKDIIFEEIINQLEKDFINIYRNIGKAEYNIADGGSGTTGITYQHTEDWKKRMSERMKGENNHWYGKHHTEEHKKKISEILKGENCYWYGKHLTEEHKKKISEKKKGKIASETSRKKMSESRQGIKYTEERRKKIITKYGKKIINIDTGEKFDCIAEAAQKYNIKKSNISSCCVGRQKTAGGYHWRYLNND
jgi:group I intron endonuclease